MQQCIEFAVFRIAEENAIRVIELSEAIFSEMNADGTVIMAYEVLRKTDSPEEICWHLTWINEDVAKETTGKWPTFPSTKEFQELIVEDVYYGHFVRAVL